MPLPFRIDPAYNNQSTKHMMYLNIIHLKSKRTVFQNRKDVL